MKGIVIVLSVSINVWSLAKKEKEKDKEIPLQSNSLSASIWNTLILLNALCHSLVFKTLSDLNSKVLSVFSELLNFLFRKSF